MNWHDLNKQLVTFCAIALLFLGSLFYFVSIAFKNTEAIEERKQSDAIQDYIDSL
jgi:hypothetical protein